MLGRLLIWRNPALRRVRWKLVVLYLLMLTGLLYAALRFVAALATAVVPAPEVLVVLWFTITCRLGWEVYARELRRLGQRWLRLARWRRIRRQSRPLAAWLIPPLRAAITLVIVLPLFLGIVLTHRCKLRDGQTPRSLAAVPYEGVRIPTADGLILAGWFVPQPGAERTIVICHGAGANKGNFVAFLPPLLFHGYNIVFFDFRAHGDSDGRTASYGVNEQRDVRAVVDWLWHTHPDQARRIVGLGSSQGALALALAARQDDRIAAVILDSPFVSPHELAHHCLGRVPLIGDTVADLVLADMSLAAQTNFFGASAADALAEMTPRPLLVIHGDRDWLMPAAHSQRLYDAARGPKAIWFGPGPHSNIVTTDPDAYAQHLFEFLDRNLGAAPGPIRAGSGSTTQSQPNGGP